MKGIKEHVAAEELIFKNTVTIKAIMNIMDSKGILKVDDVDKEVNRMDREFDKDILKN